MEVGYESDDYPIPIFSVWFRSIQSKKYVRSLKFKKKCMNSNLNIVFSSTEIETAEPKLFYIFVLYWQTETKNAINLFPYRLKSTSAFTQRPQPHGYSPMYIEWGMYLSGLPKIVILKPSLAHFTDESLALLNGLNLTSSHPWPADARSAKHATKTAVLAYIITISTEKELKSIGDDCSVTFAVRCTRRRALNRQHRTNLVKRVRTNKTAARLEFKEYLCSVIMLWYEGPISYRIQLKSFLVFSSLSRRSIPDTDYSCCSCNAD